MDALLQRLLTPKDNKAVRCALTAPFCAFHAAQKHTARLSFQVRLREGRENVGTENGKKLTNAGKKNLHVFAI